MDRFTIVTVSNGAASLRSLEHGETFHPGVGPMEEARQLHAAQHGLAARQRPGEALVVWDVGLGAAANALALVESLRDTRGPVRLVSFDQTLEPLRFALRHAALLGYLEPWRAELETLAGAGRATAGAVEWELALGDFHETVADEAWPAPHAVIFDPYSPTANPGMWTREVFAAIRARAAAECTLSSYSRSTVTRANLLLAGWHVGHGASTGEKTETTIAATRRELLAEPLGAGWLGRLRRSSAPGLSLEMIEEVVKLGI